jgi:hypothetical protein
MIIGISGKSGSGKDTVAQMISFHSYRWEIKSFAGNLKKMLAIALNIPVENLYNREFIKDYVGDHWTSDIVDDKLVNVSYTYRDLLQLLGTNVCRIIHPTFWVNSLFAHYSFRSRWIISDVRFKNEIERTKLFCPNAVFIKIEREQLESNINKTHISETELDNHIFDYTIKNNSDLNHLLKEVEKFLRLYDLLQV